MSRVATLRGDYTTTSLGINFPWANNHAGGEKVNFLGSTYNATQIHSDLTTISGMGIKKIRVWATIETMYSYSGGVFTENATFTANFDDFLNFANGLNIQVIPVMATGNEAVAPVNLDGGFHWDLIQSPSGLTTYQNAYVAYLNRFKSHTNILMWEMFNEPYGAGWNTTNPLHNGFSAYATSLNVTPTQIIAFLKQMYNALKPLAGSTPVGFSDYEEEQQPTWFTLYSNSANRATYIDPATDVYSVHIYRMLTAELWNNYQSLTKPLWITELGAYNFTGTNAGVTGANELTDATKNARTVYQLSPFLYNGTAALIMPWAYNSGSVMTYNADGTSTQQTLGLWLQGWLKSRAAAGTRSPAPSRPPA